MKQWKTDKLTKYLRWMAASESCMNVDQFLQRIKNDLLKNFNWFANEQNREWILFLLHRATLKTEAIEVIKTKVQPAFRKLALYIKQVSISFQYIFIQV